MLRAKRSEKPRFCARCNSPYWDKLKGKLKRGRPKKKMQ
jgi:hypothetical protein